MKSFAPQISRRGAVLALAALGALGPYRRSFGQAPNQARQSKTSSAAQREAANAPWLSLPSTPNLPIAARSGHAEVNGVRLFYAQFGAQGPALIMLHGGLANSNYWGHQIERLARDFIVTVIDTRGHGRSPLMSNEFSYAVFATDVVGLMNELQIPSAAIVGWSDGAMTGLQLAIAHPDRVTKLFCFGAACSSDGTRRGGSRTPVYRAYLERCKSEYPALSPQPERWAQLLDRLRSMWRSPQKDFTPERLALVKAPTEICGGEHDEIIKPEHAIKISEEIKGARAQISCRAW